MTRPPFEQFPALSAIGICWHVFTQRIPGVDVSHDKAEVLKRLNAAHTEIRRAVGMGDWPLFTAQQIHGNKVAIVDEIGSALCADRGHRNHYHAGGWANSGRRSGAAKNRSAGQFPCAGRRKTFG